MAQQSRFNAHAAAHIMSLDDRVRSLEQLAARGAPGSQTPLPPASETPPPGAGRSEIRDPE
ncbi:MAG TPA: hypothetical protein VGY97_06235 [Solirubrobacteraceae bacterium]|jgi:hypothetical protein|nr:hypothetical protein [Solirubrobacteraceae bacterium]